MVGACLAVLHFILNYYTRAAMRNKGINKFPKKFYRICPVMIEKNRVNE